MYSKVMCLSSDLGCIRPEGYLSRPVERSTCSSALSTTEAMFKRTSVLLRASPSDELIVYCPLPQLHPCSPAACTPLKITWKRPLLSHSFNNSTRPSQSPWYGITATESTVAALCSTDVESVKCRRYKIDVRTALHMLFSSHLRAQAHQSLKFKMTERQESKGLPVPSFQTSTELFANWRQKGMYPPSWKVPALGRLTFRVRFTGSSVIEAVQYSCTP